MNIIIEISIHRVKLLTVKVKFLKLKFIDFVYKKIINK